MPRKATDYLKFKCANECLAKIGLMPWAGFLPLRFILKHITRAQPSDFIWSSWSGLWLGCSNKLQEQPLRERTLQVRVHSQKRRTKQTKCMHHHIAWVFTRVALVQANSSIPAQPVVKITVKLSWPSTNINLCKGFWTNRSSPCMHNDLERAQNLWKLLLQKRSAIASLPHKELNVLGPWCLCLGLRLRACAHLCVSSERVVYVGHETRKVRGKIDRLLP